MNDTAGDELAIRSLIATWMEASSSGHLDRVLELMDEDVVFLGPGRPPMRGREAFAAASRAAEGRGRMEGRAEIQEVQVSGAWAYTWTQLTVTTHPAAGAAEGPSRLAGPALSVFRKTAEGRWVLFRDANMIAPAGDPPASPGPA
jgi:uncharacterized protein (TIGR02246 family)